MDFCGRIDRIGRIRLQVQLLHADQLRGAHREGSPNPQRVDCGVACDGGGSRSRPAARGVEDLRLYQARVRAS